MSIRPRAHLSDDRLVEVCFDRRPTRAEAGHLDACAECSARRSRLSLMLHEISDAADAEASAVFAPERLAAQHARILQRIEQDGRPARVIAFPATAAADVRPARTRPATRWIALAAAAGLALGLLAGHLAQELSMVVTPARTVAVRPAPQPETAAVHTIATVANEEEFLGELESAIMGPQLAVLRPLNDLTPQLTDLPPQ